MKDVTLLANYIKQGCSTSLTLPLELIVIDMRKIRMNMIVILSTVLIFLSCATWTKTQKGAVVGTTGGGAMGAIIGRATGNTALGAIIGAAVGGTAGAVIGNKMDKQAEQIKKTVPDAKVERVGEGIVVEFNSNVLFGFDKSGLSGDAKTNLDKLVLVLDNYADTDIELQGHTDSKGSVNYNQNLSVSRASAVSDYLVDRGISRSRVVTKGFGEEVPKYDNDSESGRTKNRRVEFLISANEKMRADAKREASN